MQRSCREAPLIEDTTLTSFSYKENPAFYSLTMVISNPNQLAIFTMQISSNL